MAIATLTIDMVAKLANLEKDMGRAAHIAEKNAAKMDAAFRKVSVAIGAIAGAASLGALANMVTSVSAAGDQLAKLSSKTGEAVEELSKLQYAGSLADVSTEDLGTSLIRLNKLMGEAKDGSQSATDALKRFGIDPASGIGTAEAFKQIAERVKNTGDETKIAAALNDVFGKSYATLIPLLKGGASGLKESADELERFGGVMSGELARSSEAFNDNMTRLSKTLDSLKVRVIGPLIPVLDNLSKEMLEAGRIGETFGEKMTLFLFRKPSTDMAENVADLRKEVAGLEKDIARFKGMNAPTDSLETGLEFVKKRLELAEFMRREEMRPNIFNPPARASGEAAARSMSGGGIVDDGIADAEGKPVAGNKTKPVQEYNALATAADAYNKALDAIAKTQLSAIDSTRDLDAAQSALLDLQRSDKWDMMDERWQKVAIAQAAAASETIKLEAIQKRVNEVLEKTPTAQLEKARELMIALTAAFEAGDISAEKYGEAVQVALGEDTLAAQAALNAKVEAEAQRHTDKIKELDDQLNSNRYSAQMMMISGAQDLSDNLMQILKDSGQEGSAIGKALFAAQKAMQVATIIMQGNAAAAAIQAGMAQAGAIAASLAGPAGPAVLAGYMAEGAAMALLQRGISYANAGLIAGSAIASAEGGYDIPHGVNPITQLHEEEMVLPKQLARTVRRMAGEEGGGGAVKWSIVNNGSPLRIAGQQRVSDDEWALIVEDAVNATAAQLGDPNSRTSRAMGRHLNVQRSR